MFTGVKIFNSLKLTVGGGAGESSNLFCVKNVTDGSINAEISQKESAIVENIHFRGV